MLEVHEDIFGAGNAIGLIIKWSSRDVANFDKANSKSFGQLREQLEGREVDCHFFNTKTGEHQVIVPLEDSNEHLQLYIQWDGSRFTHKAWVKGRRKTRLEQAKNIPDGDEYRIDETCILSFVDIEDNRFPVREQQELADRISRLEVLPTVRLEEEREIWDKWIEAQELILKRRAEPFEVARHFPLSEIKDAAGEVVRYKFSVALPKREANEYKELEDELRKEFDITDKFDPDGNIHLKKDDIYRGLDAAILKKFSDQVEREKRTAAVLKLKPLPIGDRIQSELKKSGKRGHCQKLVPAEENDFSSFVIQGTKLDQSELHSAFDIPALSYRKTAVSIRVINHGKELIHNKRFNERKKIGFSDKVEHGHILPKPVQNVFTLNVNELDYNVIFNDAVDKATNAERRYIKQKKRFGRIDLIQFLQTLQRLYGKQNVLIASKKYFFSVNSKRAEDDQSSFTQEFWQDIRRDLYTLDFEVNVSEVKSTITYEFETEQECMDNLERLEAIGKFQFVITPRHPEFKFKVQTDLIKYKNERLVLSERIRDLANTEFFIEHTGQNGRSNKRYDIGKLDARESDDSNLVFTIHNRSQEKEKVRELVKYLNKTDKVKKVVPNLIGDRAKISWLRQAMKKVTAPSSRPNGRTVNSKLGEFMFDSSKAEEVFKNIEEGSEEWERVKNNELLKLNNSQRKAVLSALHARDLCLLQGPPGTGKTTVIAELIWQHISDNQQQKILLTSETNLAVDNALEKLLNKDHTLVKPLRFGRETKFEEEGRKYSIDRIMKWIDPKIESPEYEEDSQEEDVDGPVMADDHYNNAVQIWMNRIAEKSHQNHNPKYSEALKEWAFELTQPSTEIKRIFKDKYFKYANVVGSTCSSSGSGSFVKSYQLVFNTTSSFQNDPGNKRSWVPVEFDAVVMDEASKATPPEMLLPLCFGKKSIVIGDHKQLPPMLHDKDFRELLQELKTDRALALSEEIDREFVQTSQFERLIMNSKIPASIAARLNIQYRMHPKINNVIRQFYEDETDEGLYPADELTRNADDPNLTNPFSRSHGLWHEGFINPDVHTLWVNVDEPEELSGTSRVNIQEVDAVKRVLAYLKNSRGFKEYFSHWGHFKDEEKRIHEQEIGLITFYGHQVTKLKEAARFASQLDMPVRLKTVDKFQGMERNIVIVSTVRSDKIKSNGRIGKNRDIGFAKAPERLNVALSRARRLLIVVGNLNFFESYKDKNGRAIYTNAINSIREEGLIINDYKSLNKYS